MKICVVAVLICVAFELGTTAVVPVGTESEWKNLPLQDEVDKPDGVENIVLAAEDVEYDTGEVNSVAVVPVGTESEWKNLPLQDEVDKPDGVENIVLAAEDVEYDTGEVNSVAERAVYCPPGWINYGSRCFLLVRSGMTWLSAENYCVNQRGSLISVTDPTEYHFLQSLLTISGITSNVWIGAYNFQNTWRWIDRTGFFYNNWYSQSSVSSLPCAYMRSNTGWANTNCASSFAFFCSFNPTAC